jgi:sporulation protein YqfC
MKKIKSPRNILEKAAETFDLPAEVLAGMPKITMTGYRRVHIECHKGLLEYDGSLIVVNGGPVIIKVRGEELELCSMSSEELLITGTVYGIDFE